MNLAYKWSLLQSTELIKMYGFTLSSPYTMVIESTRLGPLDEFLMENRNITIVCLIDAAFSLARALYYLVSFRLFVRAIECIMNFIFHFYSKKITQFTGKFDVDHYTLSNLMERPLLCVWAILDSEIHTPKLSKSI